jgi:hypothetical protein
MTKLVIVASLLFGGCMASGGAYVSGGATVYTPDLVDVEPGVQVIADYDEPIFYSENYYWRNNGGRWYRSTAYNGGWVEASPPVAVGRINSPDRYRHWHPAGYQPHNRGPEVRDHRDNPAPRPGPEVRDHRDNSGPGPEVRDHRDNSGRGPEVRDHRDNSGPGPEVRDHRDNTGPEVHDHRDNPGPNERNGRDNGDHRDNHDHHDNH